LHFQTNEFRHEFTDSLYIEAPWGYINTIDSPTRYFQYQLEYRGKVYKIVCTEFIDEDGEEKMIIPDYLIPGRKYPVCVYLYAINIYSSNPKMSQRKAAKLTREEFGLETFSHTTLGRTMKALERSIKEAGDNGSGTYGNKAGINSAAVAGDSAANAEDHVASISKAFTECNKDGINAAAVEDKAIGSASNKGNDVTDISGFKMKDYTSDDGATAVDAKCKERLETAKRFPSVNDMAERKKSMSSFLGKFNKDIESSGIVIASQQLVAYWYGKYERLII
jgi:hypothetical protein